MAIQPYYISVLWSDVNPVRQSSNILYLSTAHGSTASSDRATLKTFANPTLPRLLTYLPHVLVRHLEI